MALTASEKGQLQTSQKAKGEKTAMRVYDVRDDAGAVFTAVAAESHIEGIVGTTHPDDADRKVVSITATMNEMRTYAVVEVEYSDATGEGGWGEAPTAEPHRWWIETDYFEEEYFLDRGTTPKLALLTNGKPITPRPRRLKVGYTLLIEKNVSTTYSLGNFGTYNMHVNSDTVTYAGQEFTAGQILLKMFLSPIERRNSAPYRVLTLALLIKEDLWTDRFDSRDKEALDDEFQVFLNPIKDAYGREVDFPWPLNANGTAKANADDDPFEIVLEPYSAVAMNTFINA